MRPPARRHLTPIGTVKGMERRPSAGGIGGNGAARRTSDKAAESKRPFPELRTSFIELTPPDDVTTNLTCASRLA